MAERVRIDKWLWAARFYKTRSLAAQAVDAGRVTVGGARVKPARELRIGDLVGIDLGGPRFDAVVRELSDVRGPAPVAQALYEQTADSRAARAAAAELRRLAPEPARARRGRPDKHQRRALDKLGGQG